MWPNSWKLVGKRNNQRLHKRRREESEEEKRKEVNSWEEETRRQEAKRREEQRRNWDSKEAEDKEIILTAFPYPRHGARSYRSHLRKVPQSEFVFLLFFQRYESFRKRRCIAFLFLFLNTIYGISVCGTNDKSGVARMFLWSWRSIWRRKREILENKQRSRIVKETTKETEEEKFLLLFVFSYQDRKFQMVILSSIREAEISELNDAKFQNCSKFLRGNKTNRWETKEMEKRRMVQKEEHLIFSWGFAEKFQSFVLISSVLMSNSFSVRIETPRRKFSIVKYCEQKKAVNFQSQLYVCFRFLLFPLFFFLLCPFFAITFSVLSLLLSLTSEISFWSLSVKCFSFALRIKFDCSKSEVISDPSPKKETSHQILPLSRVRFCTFLRTFEISEKFPFVFGSCAQLVGNRREKERNLFRSLQSLKIQHMTKGVLIRHDDVIITLLQRVIWANVGNPKVCASSVRALRRELRRASEEEEAEEAEEEEFPAMTYERR